MDSPSPVSLQHIWPVLVAVVIPLLFSMFAGISWWMKKLDDRQFAMNREMATRSDLSAMEARMIEHLRHIDLKLRTRSDQDL
ncbi:MAG: hypothetical protein IPI58_04265 [Alphaproteobacteria bacterium]|nr:MAG: hypothetical protein IPI58_04265 [Alphaproteobacteria bacterium]